MTFKYYDVDGVKDPLRLSPEHAELIGATEHVGPVDVAVPDVVEVEVPEVEVPADPPAPEAPKPGSKADLVARAEALGLPVDGTKADIEARLAEAVVV